MIKYSKLKIGKKSNNNKCNYHIVKIFKIKVKRKVNKAKNISLKFKNLNKLISIFNHCKVYNSLMNKIVIKKQCQFKLHK